MDFSPVHGRFAKADSEPVLHFRSIWISDFHLGTKGCQAQSLLDFLRHTKSDYLYLVGDIFDGWHLKRKWYWPQEHNDVVQKVMRCARHATKVTYLPGNHDEAARSYCGLQFGGVYVTDEIVHETVDGKKVLILHGDQFDAVMSYARWLAYLGDKAYTWALFVNRVFNAVRRLFGFPYWSLSAFLKNKVKNAVEHISAFETFIAERAQYQQIDAVLCGHIHQAEMRKIKDILYMNCGDWVESCTAVVEDMSGAFSILRWNDDREILLKKVTVSASAR